MNNKYLDKEKIVIASLIFLSLTHSLPFITHYLGLFDGMEQSKILNFMSVMILFSSIFSLISLMTRESMVPDIIDEIEFQSEKRQEEFSERSKIFIEALVRNFLRSY